MNNLPFIFNLKQLIDNRGNLVVFENIEESNFFMNDGKLLSLNSFSSEFSLENNVDTIIICLYGKINVALNNLNFLIDEPFKALIIPKNMSFTINNSIDPCEILIIKNKK